MPDTKWDQYQEDTPIETMKTMLKYSRFNDFFKTEATGGLLLLAFTVLALIWANSPFSESYFHIFEGMHLTIGIGEWTLSKTVLHWVNDGLMAVFFFVVGLEIKREVMAGQLASMRKAALPIAAAIGGMVIPAMIYSFINIGGPGANGWGIPMATDIAFTLGVLALLGSRVPTSLKVFFTALAIADDIGAVAVITLFYTHDIFFAPLLVGAGILVLLVIMNRMHVNRPTPYAILGIALWLAFLYSGVHATVAGVLLAMTIPARNAINRDRFTQKVHALLEVYEESCCQSEWAMNDHHLRDLLDQIDDLADRVQSPLQRLEDGLHPWVTYFILPVFALANAGVHLSGEAFATILTPISLGIIIALPLGKALGISAFSWLAVTFRLADLPEGVSWPQLLASSWLAGIGFTMSLFVANLAFTGPEALETAKIGIIGASLLAGLLGWFLSSRIQSEPQPISTPRRIPRRRAAV